MLMSDTNVIEGLFTRTYIPYSRKFSREKTFVKTTNKKISRRKLSRIHIIDRIWVARACDVRERARTPKFCESFLPRKFPAIRYIVSKNTHKLCIQFKPLSLPCIYRHIGITVEPPNKDHLGEMALVPCREAVPISEASFLSPYFTILHLI